MGGSSKKATPAATTPAETMRPTTTVPAAMPGQLDALSAQLAAGFGQSQPDILALLNQYYQPMQLPDYSQPMTSAPKPVAAPAPAPVVPGRTGSTPRVRDHESTGGVGGRG